MTGKVFQLMSTTSSLVHYFLLIHYYQVQIEHTGKYCKKRKYVQYDENGVKR